MAERWSDIYFDKQDRDILALVNRILESHCGASEDCLFDPNLHPHGIKEMVATPVSRMAYAVINLLRNLEAGAPRPGIVCWPCRPSMTRCSTARIRPCAAIRPACSCRS